jgi:hypothetical protein
MTTYNYLAITNGQQISFASTDVLYFDDPAMNSQSFSWSPLSPTGYDVYFEIRDDNDTLVKSFTLVGINVYQLSSANVTFANTATVFRVGDDLTTMGDDATTAPLTGRRATIFLSASVAARH